MLSVVALVFLVGFAGGALGQFTTTIPNTTNACINSTFKSYTPNVTSPIAILIDRRVTFDPLVGCLTAVANNASCSRDGGSMLLVAAVSGTQITNSPSCSWDCGAAGCGTIVTDGNSGLPVELMGFGFEDEE